MARMKVLLHILRGEADGATKAFATLWSRERCLTIRHGGLLGVRGAAGCVFADSGNWHTQKLAHPVSVASARLATVRRAPT